VHSFKTVFSDFLAPANRRFFHGPGFNNTDFGISKRTVIKGELLFRFPCRFFNIFNHAQFMNPDGNLRRFELGIISKARDPRIGQVSARSSGST